MSSALLYHLVSERLNNTTSRQHLAWSVSNFYSSKSSLMCLFE
jgi:hypothetical protein